MDHEKNPLILERLRKLDDLRKNGINPYPYKYNQTHHAQELLEKYKHLDKEHITNDTVSIAGRIMQLRRMGKITFMHLQDETGRLQVYVREDDIGKDYETLKLFDLGDIIGVNGTIFTTKTGEITVHTKQFQIITKGVRPLPEKWHGLTDKEERYRKRYLDLITNPEIKDTFIKRAKILSAMRTFMQENNFIEVETPILQPVYGGAMAKPFKTHIEAYNTDIYLSIAPELPLKKCLVGGFERVYEITKKFRNEGVDRTHNPEHMTIEWYQSYADYNDGMDLVEEMMKKICMDLFGSLTFTYQGNTIDLSTWKRITLHDAIKEQLGEDVSKIKTDAEAKKLAAKHGIKTDEITTGNVADELMKLFRHKLIQPTFLIDYPSESSPLAKRKKNDPATAEVFQPFVGGLELGRAYSELNDPKIQEDSFNEQITEREKGNMEAMMPDMDFVEALEYGMPPACGVGLGMERVVMLFTDQTSIRDVILFPFMKPLDGKTESHTGKAKKTMMAVAIVNKKLNKEAWQTLNTVAHLTAAFGARQGLQLLMQDEITTKDHQQVKLNIQHAIMIKETTSNDALHDLIAEAKKVGIEIAEFTTEMQETTDDVKIIANTKEKAWDTLEYLGVLVYGQKLQIEKLTKDYKLYSGK